MYVLDGTEYLIKPSNQIPWSDFKLPERTSHLQVYFTDYQDNTKSSMVGVSVLNASADDKQEFKERLHNSIITDIVEGSNLLETLQKVEMLQNLIGEESKS